LGDNIFKRIKFSDLVIEGRQKFAHGRHQIEVAVASEFVEGLRGRDRVLPCQVREDEAANLAIELLSRQSYDL
jgi:hypothetical protein